MKGGGSPYEKKIGAYLAKQFKTNYYHYCRVIIVKKAKLR